MACAKHGYKNPTFCPVCDDETIEQDARDLAVALRQARWVLRDYAAKDPEMRAAYNKLADACDQAADRIMPR